MYEVGQAVINLIESKLDYVGYNAEDESIVLDLLNRIYVNRGFSKKFKDIATEVFYYYYLGIYLFIS